LKQFKSTLLLLMTAMIWGFAFVAQRAGSEFLGAFAFNGLRFVLGATSLIPVILIFEREERNRAKFKKTVLTASLAGVILFTASTLQQFGIVITQSAGKAGFITGLYMIIVPIASLILFRRKTNLLTWLGAACAVVGLYLLCINEREPAGWGEAVLLIGSFFWAAHIMVIDRFVEQISPIKFASVQFYVCGILSLICSAFTEQTTISAVQSALIPFLYSGLMSVGVAYTCQIIGQKHADPTFASIILSTESVFAAIGGAILMNETMTARGYIGCVIIFIGIILAQLKPNKSEHSIQA